MENSPIELIVEMHFLLNLRTVSYLLIWKLIRLSKPQKTIKNLPRTWAFWSLAWASYALAASPAPCRVRHCWKAWFEPPLCMEFPSVWDKLRHKTGIHLRGSFKRNPMKPSSLALNTFHIHEIYLNFSLKSPLLRVPWPALLWAPGTSLPAEASCASMPCSLGIRWSPCATLVPWPLVTSFFFRKEIDW